MLPQLYDWAVKQAEQAKYRTVGLFIGALGFGYNSDLLAKQKLPEPKCWADLARPEYRDELQIANPNASSTAYMTIATLVQVFDEDKAFDLLRGMHRNTNNYPRTGAGAIRAVGRGETTLGVTFLDDGVIDMPRPGGRERGRGEPDRCEPGGRRPPHRQRRRRSCPAR